MIEIGMILYALILIRMYFDGELGGRYADVPKEDWEKE